MFAMTNHGTIVALDEDNNLIQVDPDADSFVGYLVIQETSGGGYSIRSSRYHDAKIEPAQNGFSIKIGGFYICAEPRQRFLSRRDNVLAWETFTLVPEEDAEVFLRIQRSPEAEVSRFREAVTSLNARGLPVKLYCGAGTVPKPGFLNLDQVVGCYDFLKTNPEEYFIFPFADNNWGIPDGCVDYVYSEDFMEHIPQICQWKYLAEARRVLKTGAFNRVNTPSLLPAMKYNSDFDKGADGVYMGELQWGHISLLTPLALKEIAETIGYREAIFTTKSQGVSPYAVPDNRPAADRDDVIGNIYVDLMK